LLLRVKSLMNQTDMYVALWYGSKASVIQLESY
jgi:hypothetical protein